MTTVQQSLRLAQSRLEDTAQLDTADAKIEAQLLLQSLLNVNRAWLIAHGNEMLPSDMQTKFDALLTRRLSGEPIAYILGNREFYGLSLNVTPDTLIPRPDTEILVETALAKIPADKSAQVLDLGTGTGAIALAIGHQRPQVDITAADASPAALQVAINNGQQLALHNVKFVHSNWFSALEHKRFDVIVSNPPYIEQNDTHLTQGDLRFEPMSALASGIDGLDDIRQIVADSLAHLKPQGWLMLEHGYNQADAVAELMANAGLVDIATFKDFGGNDRVTIGKNPLIVSTHWD